MHACWVNVPNKQFYLNKQVFATYTCNDVVEIVGGLALLHTIAVDPLSLQGYGQMREDPATVGLQPIG
jgi:hypothetical protein